MSDVTAGVCEQCLECARAHYQTDAKSGGRITEHRPDVEGVLLDAGHRSAVFIGTKRHGGQE